MAEFITAALAVTTAMSTGFIAFVTAQLANLIVVLILGVILFLMFYGKIIGAIKGIGGGKKRRK